MCQCLGGPSIVAARREEGLDMGYEVRVRAEVGDRARGPLYAAVQAAGSFLQPAFQVDKILIR